MPYTLETPIADTTNLLRLADFIDRPEYEGHFNMGVWLEAEDLVDDDPDQFSDAVRIAELAVTNPNQCGTSACIGGSAEALMVYDLPPLQRREFTSREICKWLGLPVGDDLHAAYGGEAGYALFSPAHTLNDGNHAINLTDGHRAARVLRHLAATNIIDWSKAERQEGDA